MLVEVDEAVQVPTLKSCHARPCITRASDQMKDFDAVQLAIAGSGCDRALIPFVPLVLEVHEAVKVPMLCSDVNT